MTKKLKISFLFQVLAVLFFIALLFSACEPETKITFENNQNREVKIFVAHVRENGTIDKLAEYGTISARTTKTFYITFLGNEWVNRIEAVDPSGKVVFSHDYKRSDLEKIDWKITIPP